MELAPRSFLATLVLTALATLTGMALLPHDRYLRYQQLAHESVHYLRAKWIYERIHFDSTPIDVAFFGTSHTQSGIDSQLVEDRLNTSGVEQHVVNFAIPHLGRDLHYLLARELIENRTVKKLVIELQETEARAPHPAFQRLGNVNDLVSSPLIINIGYFENLLRLPLRQFRLFIHDVFPATSDYKLEFDPNNYEGQHWNDTYIIHGTETPRLATHTAESLSASAAEMMKSFKVKQSYSNMLLVPGQSYGLLQRYNYHYLEAMLELAKARGVEIVFLYLPFFHAPEQPIAADYLSHFGRILKPITLLDDPGIWQNASHLNRAGAARLSVWVADALAGLD